MIKKIIFLSCMLCNIAYGSESTNVGNPADTEIEQINFIRETVVAGILIEYAVQQFLPRQSRTLNLKIARAALREPIPDTFIFKWDMVLPESNMRLKEEALKTLKPLHPDIVQMARTAILKIQEEQPFPTDSALPFHLNRLKRYIETPYPE